VQSLVLARDDVLAPELASIEEQLGERTADDGRRWGRLEALAERRGWPDRLVIALELSLFGPVDRAAYAAEADVSPATASADFRRLLDAGLVDASGSGRSVRYRASEPLRRLAAGDA